MNKKILGFTAIYAIFMASLLFLTFQYSWNPSGYSYEVDHPTLIIKEGLLDTNENNVNITENMSDVLLLQVAVGNVQTHWKQDLIVMALFFPLILFSIFKNSRPFKNVLPYKWFVGLSVAIITIYLIVTVPAYVTEISAVDQYVKAVLD
ncbi:hypothetical protein [Halobacillus seohaensis]|uniref:Uncharacterized protein n=1 Tax=Halobacillus seohaensis TaxID=447421 RepID=A0ABW2EJ51_9BACI